MTLKLRLSKWRRRLLRLEDTHQLSKLLDVSVDEERRVCHSESFSVKALALLRQPFLSDLRVQTVS